MLIDCDYKIIGKIDNKIIESLKNVCLSIDWNDPQFIRKENKLREGKLYCLPYLMISPVQKQYSEESLELTNDIQNIMSMFPGHTIVRGELSTLDVNTKLDPHIDRDWFHRCCRRIHIPVFTNDKCEHIFEGRSHHLEEGYVYEINNRIMHSGINNGTYMRIHLILDLMDTEIFETLTPHQKTFSMFSRMVADPINGKEVE